MVKRKKKPVGTRQGVTFNEEKALLEPISPSNPSPKRRRPWGELGSPDEGEAALPGRAEAPGADSLAHARSPLAGRRRHPPGDRHGRGRRFGTPGEATRRAARALVSRAERRRPRPSGAGQQAARRVATGTGLRAWAAHPSSSPNATRVLHTGGGGAALTRTTSNPVPPAPLSADANVGTPDPASGRRK